jgi:pyruvate, orthophosphate dikinase
VSLNGTTGEVIKRAVPLVEPAPPLDEDGDLATVLRWVDAYRELDVRANADDADDARRAFRAGAAGVGLARTEHMFFGSKERVDTVRRLVLADDDKTRAAALQALLPLQRADFAGLFRAAGSRPVCVRLLDPPLHEFLPKPGEFESTPPFDAEKFGAATAELTALTGQTEARVLERTRALRETNPMLGLRGCRVGITCVLCKRFAPIP